MSEMAKNNGITVVITAAGSSERFGRDKTEQLLCGHPCIVHTLRAFEKSEQTLQTVVVTRSEKIEYILDLKTAYDLQKLTAVVVGGHCRQSSAAAGFIATDPDIGFIAVHDGARPLITPEDIDRVAEEAYRYGAAIAAMPMSDTVKSIGEDGFINETLDRSKLLRATTPQIFSREIYADIVRKFADSFDSYTDDSSMAEALGIKVKTVICDPSNIKITTPADIVTAEAFLTERRQSGNR